MIDNPVIHALMAHRSIRSYTDAVPSDEVVTTIVRAGQQAPFAYQLGSVLLSRRRERNPFHAPLLFTICADAHRIELVMAQRGWKLRSNDLHVLLFGTEDAIMMAQNMVIAAESLGLGTCYLGAAQSWDEAIAEEYNLPKRVFPVVGLAAGYPAEDPPSRPRYPLEFTLFEDRYPEIDAASVKRAMQVMDDGYLAQDYYRRANFMIPPEEGRKESFTFDNYSWTEHISRKLGQWNPRSVSENLTFETPCCGAAPHWPLNEWSFVSSAPLGARNESFPTCSSHRLSEPGVLRQTPSAEELLEQLASRALLSG